MPWINLDHDDDKVHEIINISVKEHLIRRFLLLHDMILLILSPFKDKG